MDDRSEKLDRDYVDAWQQLVRSRTHTFTDSELIRKAGAIERLFTQSSTRNAAEAAALGRLVIGLLLAKPRLNHKSLSQAQRNTFNNALKSAHDDGSYDDLIGTLGESKDDPASSTTNLTFLPWSRAYLSQFETLLQTYEPDVRIPYWDFCRDHTLPDWVYRPEDLSSTRGPLPYAPPEIDEEEDVLAQTTLSEFAHQNYFLWIKTLVWAFEPAPQTADFGFWDPLQLLIRANWDRIWDAWQRATLYKLNPAVSPSFVLSPMTETVGGVRSTYYLYYFYPPPVDLRLPPHQRQAIEMFPQLALDPQWFIAD
jgi:hypothetical protein